MFAAALIAEFILLLILYERFWLPLVVIASFLLSTTAVFIASWVTGVALDIAAPMGMTMVVGIGTEVAIFYLSEYTELLHSMAPRAALREASRNRLRLITMTTLASILTLLPLALAVGQETGIKAVASLSAGPLAAEWARRIEAATARRPAALSRRYAIAATSRCWLEGLPPPGGGPKATRSLRMPWLFAVARSREATPSP